MFCMELLHEKGMNQQQTQASGQSGSAMVRMTCSAPWQKIFM